MQKSHQNPKHTDKTCVDIFCSNCHVIISPAPEGFEPSISWSAHPILFCSKTFSRCLSRLLSLSLSFLLLYPYQNLYHIQIVTIWIMDCLGFLSFLGSRFSGTATRPCKVRELHVSDNDFRWRIRALHSHSYLCMTKALLTALLLGIF